MSMRLVSPIKLLTLMLVVDCVHPSPPSPVACPAEVSPRPSNAPPPIDTSSRAGPIRIDGAPPLGVVAPLTLALDNRVVATVRAGDDTAGWAKVWQLLEPSTIRRIDVFTGAEATRRFPTAVGSVIAVTRCYSSDIATNRPNER